MEQTSPRASRRSRLPSSPPGDGSETLVSQGTVPVLRDVLRTQIKDRIMRGIIEGQYPPGARLVETRLAREFGVSQAPVREALRDLESVGVVRSFPFRGTHVRKPSRAELLEAFPVRAALESVAVAEATTRISQRELEELERLILVMIGAADQNNLHQQSVANAQFHALIVHASGNATLGRLWAQLEPFARTYLTAYHSGIDLVRLAERHRKILVPMQRGDAAAAAAVMREHLMEAARWLEEGGLP